MKNELVFTGFLLALLFVSCNNSGKDEGQELYPFHTKVTKPDFESVKLIELQSESGNPLGEELRVKILSDNIYIADLKNWHSVFRFNKNGEFLNRIGKRGRGPNELVKLRDFNVSGDSIELLSANDENTSITTYKTSGDLLNKKDFEMPVTSFIRMDNRYLLYCSYNKEDQPNRLFLTDLDGKIQKAFLPNNSKINIPVFENNFVRMNSTVFFRESFNHRVYRFENESLSCDYRIDFGKYAIPEKFYRMELMEGFNLIDRNGFGIVEGHFNNQHLSVFDFIIQKQGHVTFYQYCNENSSGKQKLFAFDEEEKSVFKNLVMLTESNELVYLVFPYEIIDNDKELFDNHLSNPKLLENLDYQKNPFLMFCKIKFR